MPIKDANDPNYFDPAWAFLKKESEEIANRFDFGNYTIWPGYFEHPADPKEGYHLDVEIAPKQLEMFGGPDDGAKLHSTIGCDDILGLGQSWLLPEEGEENITITYRNGVVRISGQYREDPNWHITFVIHPEPQKHDEADVKLNYYCPGTLPN